MLGKSRKNQTLVRLIVYFGQGHKKPWILATDRLDLTAKEIVGFYTRRMGIEASFRDMKGRRFGWGLKNISIKSDISLTLLGAASMVAYAFKMAAGEYMLKKDPDAMFPWTRPRRSLLAVGRNAIQFAMLDIDELISILSQLPLRRNNLQVKELPKESLIKGGSLHKE